MIKENIENIINKIKTSKFTEEELKFEVKRYGK